MKVAPIHAALSALVHISVLVHTDQHSGEKMEPSFFEDLGTPGPEVTLEVRSQSHHVQSVRTVEHFETVVLEHQPNWLLVAGDVNETIGCALVAIGLGVNVAHFENGLRSGDRSMSEEINRILLESISGLLPTPAHEGNKTLARDGVRSSTVRLVEHAMLDLLVAHLSRPRDKNIGKTLGLYANCYAAETLHRPLNVDESGVLAQSLSVLFEFSQKLAVVLPLHSLTRGRIESEGLSGVVEQVAGLLLVEPLGYLEFLAMQAGAKFVKTDSSTIQEETTSLRVPLPNHAGERHMSPSRHRRNENRRRDGSDDQYCHFLRTSFTGGENSQFPKLRNGTTRERLARGPSTSVSA